MWAGRNEEEEGEREVPQWDSHNPIVRILKGLTCFPRGPNIYVAPLCTLSFYRRELRSAGEGFVELGWRLVATHLHARRAYGTCALEEQNRLKKHYSVESYN